MKFKLTAVLGIGLIPVLFGIAFTADAAPPKRYQRNRARAGQRPDCHAGQL
jgi:hypothetical protein